MKLRKSAARRHFDRAGRSGDVHPHIMRGTAALRVHCAQRSLTTLRREQSAGSNRVIVATC